MLQSTSRAISFPSAVWIKDTKPILRNRQFRGSMAFSMKAAARFVLALMAEPGSSMQDTSEPKDESEYMFVLEGMALTIIVLLASNCWLLRFRTTPAPLKVSGVSTKTVGVQCDLECIEALVHGSYKQSVFCAPTSKRWHQSPNCFQLKKGSKIHELTPCLSCLKGSDK